MPLTQMQLIYSSGNMTLQSAVSTKFGVSEIFKCAGRGRVKSMETFLYESIFKFPTNQVFVVYSFLVFSGVCLCVNERKRERVNE